MSILGDVFFMFVSLGCGITQLLSSTFFCFKKPCQAGWLFTEEKCILLTISEAESPRSGELCVWLLVRAHLDCVTAWWTSGRETGQVWKRPGFITIPSQDR